MTIFFISFYLCYIWFNSIYIYICIQCEFIVLRYFYSWMKARIMELVVMRHGQSVWNREKKWAGWSNVPLSSNGVNDSRKAAQLISKKFLNHNQSKSKIFDQIYTSSLCRTIRTAQIILQEMGYSSSQIPITRSWRLNEKHYGILQGESKMQATKKYGEQLVNNWRRSFDKPPPPVSFDDPRHPKNDQLYKNVDASLLPSSQSLADVFRRFLPLWQSQLKIKITANKRLLIICHGMIVMKQKSLEQVSKQQIPNSTPIVYHLDENLSLTNMQYLGDITQIKKKAEKIKNQTNLKN